MKKSYKRTNQQDFEKRTNMIKIVDKSKCSGCHSCYNICPKKCIIMKEDQEGFWYPEVDVNQCINCGLCEKDVLY